MSLLSVSLSGESSESYSYDGDKELSGITRTIGSKTYTTSYQRTSAGQLTQLSYASGRAIHINHDATGRLSAIVNNGDSTNYVSGLSYNYAGQVTGWTLGGTNGGGSFIGSASDASSEDAQEASQGIPILPMPPPPLPRPNVPPGSPQKFKRAINDALADIDQRLRDRPACAALFGGLENALAILSSTEYRFLDLGGPEATDTGGFRVTGAQTNSPTSVFINSQGPFINQTLFVSGGRTQDFSNGMNATSFRALLILHELGHQSGVFQPDRTDPDLNRTQTQKIIDACFN
jgi:YD repeat-containing protein